MKKNFCSIGFVSILVITLTAVFSMGSTAPRISSSLFEEEDIIKIFAYENPPFVTMKTDDKGVLTTIVREALKGVEPEPVIDILPVRSLMKYLLLQDVGLAGIAQKTDFTQDELKNLMAIPLYEKGETQFLIFFNKANEKWEQISKIFKENLEKRKERGSN